jgi:hypothetical protein
MRRQWRWRRFATTDGELHTLGHISADTYGNRRKQQGHSGTHAHRAVTAHARRVEIGRCPVAPVGKWDSHNHSVPKLRRDFPNCLAAASNEVAQGREILVNSTSRLRRAVPVGTARPITDSPSVCMRASRLQLIQVSGRLTSRRKRLEVPKSSYWTQ